LVLHHPDLLEQRTGQIERAQASAFLVEAKLTSLSFFAPVTQLCSNPAEATGLSQFFSSDLL
jgi:hypothetical protein